LPRKIKPSKYKPAGAFSPAPIKDEYFSKIQEIFDTVISKEIKERLQKATVDYIIFNKSFVGKPNVNQMKASLELISKHTKQLTKILKNMDVITWEALTLAYVNMPKKTLEGAALGERMQADIKPGMEDHLIKSTRLLPEDIDKTLYRFQRDLTFINGAAEIALNKLTDDKERSGPKRTRDPLKNYINDLEEIYFQITGKRGSISRGTRAEGGKGYGKYKGTFFNFVNLCLNSICEEIPNSTLGSHIEVVLKEKRRKAKIAF